MGKRLKQKSRPYDKPKSPVRSNHPNAGVQQQRVSSGSKPGAGKPKGAR